MFKGTVVLRDDGSFFKLTIKRLEGDLFGQAMKSLGTGAIIIDYGQWTDLIKNYELRIKSLRGI